MSYEIKNLHIEPESPEGRGLEAIIARDDVTPEEAIRQLLRQASPKASAAERLIGLFSQAEAASLLDEVVELSRSSRETPSTRDIG